VLTDADLIDAAAVGDDLVQLAIALRPRVPVPVAAALAEIASPVALAALVDNRGAEIPASSFARMVERHGSDAELRAALLDRADLPLDIRQAIAVALADCLSAFVSGCGWLSRERCERIAREAREKTTVALSAAAEAVDMQRLVAHLRRSAQLTPALILRAVLSGNLAFVEAAFADLTGFATTRVAGLLRDPRSTGFGALYGRAGLPASLEPAFAAAFAALRETARDDGAPEGANLSRRMIQRVPAACAALPPEEAGKLLALLRRFEVEAAREEARELADAIADQAALAAVLEYTPEALLDSYRRDRLLDAA
jgi:uncharacterized protein (DUF2336 family)